jgi:hypothetical protein
MSGSYVFNVTLSLDTNIYADGDVLAATQQIAKFFPANNYTALITGIMVSDEDDQGTALDLILMSAATDIGAENSAYDITDAESRTILGVVRVAATDFYDWGGFRLACKTISDGPSCGWKVPGVIRGTSTSLYIGAVVRSGTPTYSAAGLKLKISVMY